MLHRLSKICTVMATRKRKSDVALGSNEHIENYLLKKRKKEEPEIKLEQKPLQIANPAYRVQLGPANWKKGLKIEDSKDPNTIRLLFDDGTTGDYLANNCIQMEDYEEIEWFNFTEDCVPDYLNHNLDILFIGYNPGLMSAAKKHHYSNPTNHFWKLLHESGLIKDKVTHEDDVYLVEKYNMGLTNIVVRKYPHLTLIQNVILSRIIVCPLLITLYLARGTDELTPSEMKLGGELLRKKIQQYKPKMVCFNGKQVFTYFARVKTVAWGRQPKMSEFGDIELFVIPSTSGRVTQFTKKDKLAFFIEMKQVLDQIKIKTEPKVLEEKEEPKEEQIKTEMESDLINLNQ